jgi:acetylornithine deacetylase/succinyl-diaminopimelate desuccinylase family protein
MNKLERAISLVDEDRIIHLAKELVKIPSLTGEERNVALKAKALLENSGIDVSMKGAPERPIVVSTVNPDSDRLLAFNGHIDTVPIALPEAWSTDPYDPVVVDGRLYGRGSCDMKASCGVIIHVLEILRKIGVDLAIQAQLVPDEERGGVHGTRLLIAEMEKGETRKPDYVVIGEKSNLKVRVAERGIFRVDVRFKGRATHTAYARLEGINAIAKASKAVLALEHPLNKYHPYIGHPVLSVNMIKAGTVINQVPAECVISIDHRMIIGETAETSVSEITAILNELGRNDPDWNWEIEAKKDENGEYIYSPPNITEPDTELGQAVYRAIPRALNKKPEPFVEWAGGTDGRFYRYAGIQTIGFGPDGGHAHGPDEFVYVDSLIEQAKVYLALALELEK